MNLALFGATTTFKSSISATSNIIFRAKLLDPRGGEGGGGGHAKGGVPVCGANSCSNKHNYICMGAFSPVCTTRHDMACIWSITLSGL